MGIITLKLGHLWKLGLRTKPYNTFVLSKDTYIAVREQKKSYRCK
jgi:hypothetical protein